MVRSILRGVALVAVGLAVTGCAGGNLFSQREFSTASSAKPGFPFRAAAPEAPEALSSTGSDSHPAQGQLALARLSERREQYEQAERLFKAVMRKDPDNPVPYHRLGIIRAKQGRFQEADEYFARALELAPSDPALLSDIGYCYYLQNRAAEAEEMLHRALMLRPNDQAICNNLGVLLGEQGRDREALSMFRRAGTQAEAYANLAFVYTQRGELEKAKAYYSRALTLDQEMRPAAEAMIQLAKHEQLYQTLPADESTFPSNSELIAEAVPSPEASSASAWSGANAAHAQPITFLRDEKDAGTVEITDSAQPAAFEQSARVTRSEAEPAGTGGAASGQPRDLWDRLRGFAAGPIQGED